MDGTICVWDLGRASPVALGSGVAFSGDGLLQVRSREGKLDLIRSSDGQVTVSVEAGPQRMSELLLDHTGRTLLGVRSVSKTNGAAQLEAQLWDLRRSASLVLRLTNPPGSKLFLSSTGTRFAAADESAVTIWSNPAGQEPWIMTAPSVSELAFDHSGSRVALAHGQVVEVWDLVSQPAQRRYSLKHKLEVSHVEFAPDDRLLLTACSDPTLAPGMAQVWDTQSGRPAGPGLFHRDGVVYAAFSPQGERILTCSEDFTAVLWDTVTGQRRAVPPLRHREQVVYGGFSQNGHWVVTVERDGAVRVWDAFTAELVMPPLRHGKPISSAQFVGDDTRLAVRGVDGAVSVWELPRDPRPIEDLSRIATVLNGQRPDDAVGPAAKAEPDWIRTWAELRRRYPGEFGGR
jgi:WD40 repeat protein